MEFENFNLFNVYAPSGAKSEECCRKYRFYDLKNIHLLYILKDQFGSDHALSLLELYLKGN